MPAAGAGGARALKLDVAMKRDVRPDYEPGLREPTGFVTGPWVFSLRAREIHVRTRILLLWWALTSRIIRFEKRHLTTLVTFTFDLVRMGILARLRISWGCLRGYIHIETEHGKVNVNVVPPLHPTCRSAINV